MTTARLGLKIMLISHGLGLGLKMPRMTLFCLLNINRENLGIPQLKLQDGHAVILNPFPVVRIPCEVDGVECLDTGRTGEPRGRSFTDRGRAWAVPVTRSKFAGFEKKSRSRPSSRPDSSNSMCSSRAVRKRWSSSRRLATTSSPGSSTYNTITYNTNADRHVGFMQHLKKICRPYKHHIYGGNMLKYGTELLETNYPIPFHRIRTHGCWHSVGNQTIEVTKPNRN